MDAVRLTVQLAMNSICIAFLQDGQTNGASVIMVKNKDEDVINETKRKR